jgi:dolichol-phosphate mannosyltransferase
MRIAAVIPAYHEEAHMDTVVKRVRDCGCVERIYVIDDGSVDRTAELAKLAGAVVVTQKVNMGVGAAIRSGFVRARQDGFDIAVVMGGDNQDDPTQIPRLLKPMLDGGYDLVQGSRWLAGGDTHNIPLFRRFTTQLYALIIRVCTGFPFTDGTNGFRAVRLSILDKIDLTPEWLNRYELEPYLLYKAVKLGFKIKEAAVTKSYFLKEGYTKMVPVLDWWRILRPVIFLRLGIKK